MRTRGLNWFETINNIVIISIKQMCLFPRSHQYVALGLKLLIYCAIYRYLRPHDKYLTCWVHDKYVLCEMSVRELNWGLSLSEPWRVCLTAWHGTLFALPGHLCGESTDQRWIPLTKGPVMQSFFVVSLKKHKKPSYLCFGTPWRACDVTVTAGQYWDYYTSLGQWNTSSHI